jgi:hypothetical protein
MHHAVSQAQLPSTNEPQQSAESFNSSDFSSQTFEKMLASYEAEVTRLETLLVSIGKDIDQEINEQRHKLESAAWIRCQELGLAWWSENVVMLEWASEKLVAQHIWLHLKEAFEARTAYGCEARVLICGNFKSPQCLSTKEEDLQLFLVSQILQNFGPSSVAILLAPEYAGSSSSRRQLDMQLANCLLNLAVWPLSFASSVHAFFFT